MNLPVDPAPDFLLDPESLRAHVGSHTFERGLELLRQQKVQDCHLSRATRSEWRVEGLVGGTHPDSHSVEVTLDVVAGGRTSFFSGQCTCSVGANCKHSVALVVRAAYKSAALRAALAREEARMPAGADVVDDMPADPGENEEPGPSRADAEPEIMQPGPQAQAQAQAQVQPQPQPQAGPLTPSTEGDEAPVRPASWLDLFGSATMPATAHADEPLAPGETASSQQEQLVYLLSPAQQRGHTVLQLGFGYCQRLKTGKWGKVRMPRPGSRAEAPPVDNEIISLIETLSARTYSYPYRDNFGLLAGDAGAAALRLAAGTGRLFAMLQERVLGMPLTLGPAHALSWYWREAASTEPARHSPGTIPEPVWALVPRLPDAVRGARWFANQPPLYLHEGSGVCGVLQMPGISSEQLDVLMKAPPVPQSSLDLPETTQLRQLAGLPLPAVMQPAEVLRDVSPTARLHISALPPKLQPHLGLLRATLQFDYAGLHHYALHEINPVLIETQALTRVQLHRDLALEKSAHQRLHLLGLAGDSAGQFCLPFHTGLEQNQWLVWLDNDFDAFRQAGFEVTQEAGLASWIARADDLQVEMNAAPASNATPGTLAAAVAAEAAESLGSPDDGKSAWFDLSLGMSIGGKRQNILPLLPELLAQLAAVTHSTGTSAEDIASRSATLQLPEYIYLKQESSNYLRLPCEPLRPWLQALLDLVGERSAGKASDFKGESLKLSRLEALRMGNALGQGVCWQGASRLRDVVERLKGQAELPAIQPPEGLLAELRPYQLQGLQWLQFLRANQLGGILADDMGLGKTLQTLAHVLIEKQAGRLDLPCLIIAPVSLMGNWRQEARRFTPQLRLLVLHGAGRHEAAADIASCDIVIAPYSLLQRDRERWQKQNWHMVVLDEAQNIKNANSHAAQVAGELNTRHRLCLSGTPMENHLGELWSLFHFLMPGFLGSQARFKTLFRTPIEKRGDTERATQLRQRVTPFMLRRHKRDVATDLPDKQVAISMVELDSAQADLYETIRLSTEKTVREALASKGLGQSHIQVLDALLKLRQVCCDPRLVPVASAQKVKSSAKLELLMELLPELLAEGRKVLLFSQFTSMLALIEQELEKRQLQWVKLTGQSQKREQIIERFTSGEVPLFLISLKAGGVGLNLTQADTVIHYDPWWNPAAENQATDRAHRIGQTQRVMVYKLVAQGTIEERILALQDRKAALADSMYSDPGERDGTLFTESDLEALLRPLGG